jgi:hypothetical protein
MRVTIFNSDTGALANDTNYDIDSNNGTDVFFSGTNPTRQLRVNTSTGRAVFELDPAGNYTIFSFADPGGPPLLNGVGYQNMQFVTGQDFFVTDYFVPRSLVLNTNNQQRVAVLAWQSNLYNPSQDTSNVNLDIRAAKFDPAVGFTCYGALSGCCTAMAPTGGTCGSTSIPYDTTTSNAVEEFYVNGAEKFTATSGFASYLIYVHQSTVSPTSGPYLKLSHAQINMYSKISAKAVEIKFALQATAAQLSNSLFTPTFWVAACLFYDSTFATVSYRTVLDNTTNTSVLISTTPAPIDYCS